MPTGVLLSSAESDFFSSLKSKNRRGAGPRRLDVNFQATESVSYLELNILIKDGAVGIMRLKCDGSLSELSARLARL